MLRFGERHDGDGRTTRAVRHIRGAAGLNGGAAILALDAWHGVTGALSYMQLSYREMSFTSAAVKALRATPGVLVGAPGVGYFLEFVRIDLMLDYGSNVFTESTYNLQVRYTNTTGALVSQAIETTGFIDQAADTYTNGLPKIDAIVTTANLANQALVLHNVGGGEIAGNAANDSVLRVRTFYVIHPVLV